MSNIKVAIRVRPLNQKEKDEDCTSIVQVQANTISIVNTKVLGAPEYADSRERIKHFTFDYSYNCMGSEDDSGYASQAQVFQDLGTDVLQSAFDGFNACIFAYGQTGTGKTHTMMGEVEDIGLTPRICEGLFSHVSDCADEKVSCRVDISYFEIYNERVRDLLQPDQHRLNEKYSLKVREHPKDGPYVQDLSSHRVRDNTEIQELLGRGNQHRVTAETYMHGHSSRSHAIVSISFTQARLEANLPSEIVSKLHLVDLAGSERADPSPNSDFRKRLTEGSNINKSLVALGYVIKALAERSLLSWNTDEMGSIQNINSSGGGEAPCSPSPPGPNKQRIPYIPYRDSVLTWLLKDSLGGNSKTIMIATITPASGYYSESISTLRYAQRAKNIINKPRVNEDQHVSLIRELKEEIERLRGMLASAQMPPGVVNDSMFLVPILKKSHNSIYDTQESGTLISVPEADTIIAEKLHQNEAMAKQLTQSWMGKWASTHDLIQETDLSIRGVRNRTSSMGVMIDSQLPYLMGMDDDVLSTGIFIFHLKEGDTLIGREDADQEQDIVLSGPNIEKEHCVIRNQRGVVTLYPGDGALCAIQELECTEPTRLAQGDYVGIGGNQVFRFNNPTEAAKLRENRKSQGSLNALNVSVHSFGGLSRASSYSSIGGDDLNYLSPYSQLSRSYPNSEFEKKHLSEKDRIEDARQELEQLRVEYERAEEARQEMEERMYELHEQHKQEIEEQQRQLKAVMEENEHAKQGAQEELEHARESLVRERNAFQTQLEDERQRLKHLQAGGDEEEDNCSEVSMQTDSIQTLSVSMDTNSSYSGSLTKDIVSPGQARARKPSVEEQLKELDEVEFVRKMSLRESEQSLAFQQEDLEDQYYQTHEQIEKRIKRIQTFEEQYKIEDAQHLQEISKQNEKLNEIHKKEAQLAVYIEEKQDLMNVLREHPNPLRSACSELSLAGDNLKSVQFPQKTSSLRDLQADVEADQSQSVFGHVSTSSCESMHSSASLQPMDTSASFSHTDHPSDQGKMDTQDEPKKLTKSAKSVTSRLYKPPEPKFKYVPKTKEKPAVKSIPRTRPARERGEFNRDSSSPSPLRDKTSPSPSRSRTTPSSIRDKKSPSPLRDVGKGRHTSPSVGRDVKEPKLIAAADPKKVNQSKKVSSPAKQPSRKVSPLATVRQKDHNEPSEDNAKTKEPSETCVEDDLESESPESLRKKVNKSPDRLGNAGVRLVAPKIRQMKSAGSLASVPESAREEIEDSVSLERSLSVDPSQFGPVKRRARRGRSAWDDDDGRRHSAPVGEELADALNRYTEEIDPGFRNTDSALPLNLEIVATDTEQQSMQATSPSTPSTPLSPPTIIVAAGSDTALSINDELEKDIDICAKNIDNSHNVPLGSKRVLPDDLAAGKDTKEDVPKKRTKSDKRRVKTANNGDMEVEDEHFSDDSLDLDASSDSLEGQADKVHTERRISEKVVFHIGDRLRYTADVPMSDDSLNDSLEDQQQQTCDEEHIEDTLRDGYENGYNVVEFVVEPSSAAESKAKLNVSTLPSVSFSSESPENLSESPMTPDNTGDVVEVSGLSTNSTTDNDEVLLGKLDRIDLQPLNILSTEFTSPELPVGEVHDAQSNLEKEIQHDDTVDGNMRSPTDADHADSGSHLDNVQLWSEGTSDTDVGDSPLHKKLTSLQSEDVDDTITVGREAAVSDEDRQRKHSASSREGSVDVYSSMDISDIEEERFTTEVIIREPVQTEQDIITVEVTPPIVEGPLAEGDSEEKTIPDLIVDPAIDDKGQVSSDQDQGQTDMDTGHSDGELDGVPYDIDMEASSLQRKEIYHSSIDVTLDPDTNTPFEELIIPGGAKSVHSVVPPVDDINATDLVIHIYETEVSKPGDSVDAENVHDLQHAEVSLIDTIEDGSTEQCQGLESQNICDTKNISKVTEEADTLMAPTHQVGESLPAIGDGRPEAGELKGASRSTKHTVRPKTRSLGVGTGSDLFGDDGHSQCSNDSFLDPQDELQVLQEALEQLPPSKPLVTSAGPQLSTARRAARQRAMNQRKQRATDSDSFAQLSDESAESAGNRSISSSRPDSGSRRRRRIQNKNSHQLHKGSSEEYASSNNDSSYSIDSFDDTQHGQFTQTPETIANGHQHDFIAPCSTVNTENMPAYRNRDGLRSRSSRHSDGISETSDAESDGRRSVGVQTSDRHNHARSSGSTHTDISEDFNFSTYSEELGSGRNMVMSPLSLWNSNDSDSPNDRHSTASGGVLKILNDPDKTIDNRNATSSNSMTPRSSISSFSRSSSNLDKGPTEVWSSSASELRRLPNFSEDSSYIMETESMAPSQPSLDYAEDMRDTGAALSYVGPCGSSTPLPTDRHQPGSSTPIPMDHEVFQPSADKRLDDASKIHTSQVVTVAFPESQLSSGQVIDEATPLKFEVTIHEDNTSIQYNVEKTEYKTYSLRSPTDKKEPVNVPETIHVNLRESTVNESQESYESHQEKGFSLHRPDDEAIDDDSCLVLERSFRSSCSSEREFNTENGDVVKDSDKQTTTDSESASAHVLPSSPQSKSKVKVQKKREPHLQVSGIVGTANYNPTALEVSETEEGEHAEYIEFTAQEMYVVADESDSTSDYGTITSVDGRRGCASFTSDSDEGEHLMSPPWTSPRGPYSPGAATPGASKHLSTPIVQDWTNQHRTSHEPLENRVLEIGQQGVGVIHEEGQALCSVEPVLTHTVIAARTQQSSPVQHISLPVSTQPAEGEISENVPDDNLLVLPEIDPEICETLHQGPSVNLQQTEDTQIEEDMDTDNSSICTIRYLQPGKTEVPSGSQEALESPDSSGLAEDEDVKQSPSVQDTLTPCDSDRTKTEALPSVMETSPARSSKSNANRSSVSSTDDVYQSLENLDSSCSSDYRTPQQSPRDNDSIASPQVIDVEIPDFRSSSPILTPREEQLPEPEYSPKSPTRSVSSVRTVSVNTEAEPTALTQEPSISRMSRSFLTTDPVQTEAIRQELERKIARLQRHERSLSDSAISSDFTDGDSSLSPRASSRLYDSDKSKERRFRHADEGPLRAYRISTSPVRRAIDFEASAVNKSPFKDSGNVFDDTDGTESGHMTVGDECTPGEKVSHQETPSPVGMQKQNISKLISGKQFVHAAGPIGKFPEGIIDALLAIKPYPVKRSASLDSISTLINMGTQLSRAVRDCQSIEDLTAPVSQTEKPVDSIGDQQPSATSAQVDNSEYSADPSSTSYTCKSVSIDSNQNVVYSEETDSDKEVDVFELSLTSTSSSDPTSSDLQRSLSPGEVICPPSGSDEGQEEVEEYVRNGPRNSERSTSLSELDVSIEKQQQRCLSEGNLDEYESHNSSSCSNDSITFVFVGKRPDSTEDFGDQASEGQGASYGEHDDDYSGEADKPEPYGEDYSGYEPDSLVYMETESGPMIQRPRSSDKDTRESPEMEEDESESAQYTESGLSELPSDEALNNSATDSEICEINKKYLNASDDERDVSDGLDQGYHDDDEDSAPLRHRFGIDESVLPIQERSVSADNLPKQNLNLKNLHRSRSASMLDVGVLDDPASEEGIFPPAITYLDDDDTQPLSARTMSDGNIDQVSQRTLSEFGVSSMSSRTSSELETQSSSCQSSSISVSDREECKSVYSAAGSDEEYLEEIVMEYKKLPGNVYETEHGPELFAPEGDINPELLQNEDHFREVLKTVEKFINPEPALVDRGMSTGDEAASKFVSRGVQASLTDSGTQTSGDVSDTSLHPGDLVLPALSSPHRAQSMDSIGLGARGESKLTLSDGSNNWCTLGQLMVETTQLLRRINEQLPGMERQGSITSSEESQAILKQWQEISVQTGRSLTNLQTVGLQTEDDITQYAMPITVERSEKCASSTQIDQEIMMEPLGVSEIVTSELVAGPSETISCDICIQTDEATSTVKVHETVEMSIQARDEENICDTPIEDSQGQPTGSNVNYKRETVLTLPSSADSKKDLGREIKEVDHETNKETVPDVQTVDNSGSSDELQVTYVEEIVTVLPSLVQHENYPATGYVLPVFQYPDDETKKTEESVTSAMTEPDTITAQEGKKEGPEESLLTEPLHESAGKTIDQDLVKESLSHPEQQKIEETQTENKPVSELEALRQEHAKLMANLEKASEARKARRETVKARKQKAKEQMAAAELDDTPPKYDKANEDHIAEDKDSNCSEKADGMLSSSQEIVHININVDPTTGLTIENTRYQPDEGSTALQKKQPGSQTAEDGSLQERIWNMSEQGVTSKDSERSDENHRPAAPSRLYSTASIMSDAEVALVMAKGPKEDVHTPIHRPGANNEMRMFKEADVVEDILSDDETEGELEVHPSPVPILEEMERIQLGPRGKSLTSVPKSYGHDSKLPEELLKLKDIPRNKPKMFQPDKETIEHGQGRESPQSESKKAQGFSPSRRRSSPIEEDLIRPEQMSRANTNPFKKMSPVGEATSIQNGVRNPPKSTETARDIVPDIIEDDIKVQQPTSRYSNTAVGCTDDFTQASVDISDDCTQTDIDLPDNTAGRYVKDNVPSQKKAVSNGNTDDSSKNITRELDRLHTERTQILELLSLKYLPTSLTVELLEAKLNYCIGQTDLLLDTLDDNFQLEDRVKPSPVEQQYAREVINKYRYDLKQSQKDIQVCRERLENGKGVGRGRPRTRKSDNLRSWRQADIEAFRLERMREQQDYERSRSGTPLKGNSPQVTPRKNQSRSRSTSPAAFTPSYMTPKQHKEHLVSLRKQLVRSVVEDERQHRSCSPNLYRHSRLPRGAGYQTPSSLTFSPKISVSMTNMSDHSDTEDVRAYRYSVPPGSGPAAPRGSSSVSLDHVPQSGTAGNLHHSSTTAGWRNPYPSTMDTKMTAESVFSPQESEQILQEIEEIRQRSQMSAPMEEMLRRASFSSDTHSHRSFDSSLGLPSRASLDPRLPRQHNTSALDHSNMSLGLDLHSVTSDDHRSDRGRLYRDDLTERPYSPYSAYAREHVIPNERPELGGILHGSYELYDRFNLDRSETSSVMSFGSDIHFDHGHNSSLDEEKIKRLRPVQSSDVKAKISRHKR